MPDEQDKAVAKYVKKSGWATEPEIKECILIQDRAEANGKVPPPLIDILVEQEYISKTQRENLLKELDKKPRMFGEIAIAKKYIKEAQLQECLEIQSKIRKNPIEGFPTQIGEILVSKNYLEEIQIQKILKIQKKEAKDKDISICQHCGTQFNAKLLSGGKKLKCGKCGKPLAENAPTPVPLEPTLVKKPKKREITNAFLEETIIPPKKKKAALTLSLPQIGRSRRKKTNIPGFQIIEEIFEDAMGYVYKAKSMTDNKFVTIKLFHEDIAKDQEYIRELERELKKSSSSNIPNISKNLGIGNFRDKKQRTNYYVVSEYIEGDTLKQLLDQRIEIPLEKGVKIIIRLAKILRHAQAERVFHGDIAAHNVLVSKEGKIILLNFGIPNDPMQNILQLVEREGSASLHVSPEVAGNQVVDFRSDIYSLGALLYHLLAGKPPFEGDSPFVILNRLPENIPLPPIQVFNPNVSQELFQVIEKMMAPDPEDRYQDFNELIAHLRNPYQTSSKGGAVPAHIVEDSKDDEDDVRLNRNRGRKIPWVKITFVLALVLGIGWKFYTDNETAKKLENAQEAYFSLRDEYVRDRDKPEKWDELENKLQRYTKEYSDIEFPAEEDTVASAKENLDDLKKRRERFTGNEIGGRVNDARQLGRQNKYWAAFKKLEEIPDTLLGGAAGELSNVRRELLIQAGNNTGRLETEVDGMIRLIEDDKDYSLFQVNKMKIEPSQENLNSIYVNFIEETYKKDFFLFFNKAVNEYGEDGLVKTMQGPTGLQGLLVKLKDEEPEISQDQGKVLLGMLYRRADRQQKRIISALENYQQTYNKINKQKSGRIYSQINDDIRPMKKHFQFQEAYTKIDQQISSITFEEYQTALKKEKELLQQMANAKKALIQAFGGGGTNIVIYHQGKSYNLEKMDNNYVYLRPRWRAGRDKIIKLKWHDLPKEQYFSLIEIAGKNTTPENVYSMSLFCYEYDNYVLAFQLLNNIAPVYPPAKSRLDEIGNRLKNKAKKLLSSLETVDFKSRDWQNLIDKALDLRNKFLLQGVSESSENSKIVDSFFQKAGKQFPTSASRYMQIDFENPQDFESSSMKKFGLTLQKPPSRNAMEIDGGLLRFRGRWTIKGTNIRGMSGLIRFTKGNQKLKLDIGDYHLQISDDGSEAICRIANPFKRFPVKIQRLGSEKWIWFSVYVFQKNVYWQVNSTNIYRFKLKSKPNISELIITAAGGKIELDNISIAIK